MTLIDADFSWKEKVSFHKLSYYNSKSQGPLPIMRNKSKRQNQAISHESMTAQAYKFV